MQHSRSLSLKSHRMASFMDFTETPTCSGVSVPYLARSLIMAEPTMAPSEICAMFIACSGVEMPKPMAQGMAVFSLTTLTMDAGLS